MTRMRNCLALTAIAAGCLLLPAAHSQPGPAPVKALQQIKPVAETKLLMEGLAAANMRGLANHLRDKPRELEAWTFARGQALLIAETGNLLLLRPPQAAASQDTWLKAATNLRDVATELARAAAAKDYSRARSGLAAVANACNHCHQSFRVPQRIDPFAGE
ncbi:MAG TPA: cytochrome c [Gemmata sp.]|nr:cytochrome c [Gemmata sp.]